MMNGIIDSTIKTVPCTMCGEPTAMLGTKLCDNCWEILYRIEDMKPHVIFNILNRAEKLAAIYEIGGRNNLT